jgi:hypothetical protein
MKRRHFLESMSAMGLAGSAQAAGEKKTRFYHLHQFFLNNGTQKARLDAYLQEGIRLLDEVSSGPTICLEGLVAPHLPQVLLITGLGSFEELMALRSKLQGSAEYRKAVQEWERGEEAPYLHYSTSILEATPYSPEIAPLNPAPKTPRIFELRVYHSPTYRQLAALHERFAGPEIKIFHRTGVHPILYTSTFIGQNMPNLTYLIPFDDLAARDKAWAAFGADPEWAKVRKESIDRSGQISLNSQISLYRAAAYSPIR